MDLFDYGLDAEMLQRMERYVRERCHAEQPISIVTAVRRMRRDGIAAIHDADANLLFWALQARDVKLAACLRPMRAAAARK